jgi:transposase
MAKGLFLGTKDLVELRILEDFRAGRRTRQEAATLLGVSERAVTRRVAKLRAKGATGIKHGNRGRTPVNRLDEAMRTAAVELARTAYAAFNLAHCHERLVAEHGLACCYATFRKWCNAAGTGRRRRRRPSKPRMARERLSKEGLMLQLDGSPHAWNGKDEWCLIAAIDDATSKMPAARFFPTETTWGCFAVLRTIIERFGIPEILYTDCAGWAGGGAKRQHFSQFVRACEELNIVVLRTPSPEAKGRTERAFRTLQDRLCAELSYAGIKSMADANRYLDQVFLPGYWNERLTVMARSPQTSYRPLPAEVSLDGVLCYKHWRRVRSDHTVDLEGRAYRLRAPFQLRGKEVEARVTEAGEVSWYYGRLRIAADLWSRPRRGQLRPTG